MKIAENSFASKDNLLASKLGRLLQGHPRLLHVDLTKCALLRADLIYACWCLRDSPNILSIHLTGNFLGYHDRILIQALLAARVQWPAPATHKTAQNCIDERSKDILVQLHINGGKWIERWVRSTSAFAKLDPSLFGEEGKIGFEKNPSAKPTLGKPLSPFEREATVALFSEEIEKLFTIEDLLKLPHNQVKKVGNHANPMFGHSKNYILTRLLNHPELEEDM